MARLEECLSKLETPQLLSPMHLAEDLSNLQDRYLVDLGPIILDIHPLELLRKLPHDTCIVVENMKTAHMNPEYLRQVLLGGTQKFLENSECQISQSLLDFVVGHSVSNVAD